MNNPPLDGKIGPVQIALLVLTILVLLTLAIDAAVTLPAEASNLIQWTDNAVCILLVIDFFVRFARAESKAQFMKWGWIDLLASIPNVEALRWGRIFRIFRIVRGLRSLHRVVSLIWQNKLQSGATSLGFIAFLLVLFSSISVLILEHQAGGNIKTAEDAIWWSVTTMTTVGYGDRYPVTTEGRIVGMFLMMSGIGIFGSISALVASFFIGKRDKEPLAAKEILARLDLLQREVERLRRKDKI